MSAQAVQPRTRCFAPPTIKTEFNIAVWVASAERAGRLEVSLWVLSPLPGLSLQH